MSTIFGFDSATLLAFDSAYWASQPFPVQALQAMDASQPARTTLAYQLAGQGYFIDVPIIVWGWDPYMTMFQRQIDGYTTYPDALSAQTRKVSLNISDYPAVATPTPQGVLVGAQIGMSPYYFATEAAIEASLPAGYTTTQGGITFTLQYISQQTLSGATQQVLRWEANS
ncbi:MAG: hypothetical protein ABSB35_33890 [Bryobacteraceae bacterium]|jgi:hypothetical protein